MLQRDALRSLTARAACGAVLRCAGLTGLCGCRRSRWAPFGAGESAVLRVALASLRSPCLALSWWARSRCAGGTGRVGLAVGVRRSFLFSFGLRVSWRERRTVGDGLICAWCSAGAAGDSDTARRLDQIQGLLGGSHGRSACVLF